MPGCRREDHADIERIFSDVNTNTALAPGNKVKPKFRESDLHTGFHHCDSLSHREFVAEN
jgi:hypothetical protein